jgi:hypothetical protein
MMHSALFQDMFHLPLPVLEKLLRPVLVYLVLVALLRMFGKRELAQLNPFDLVVLLSLSNTVQNAIIGDDNSVTGGVIGAFSLLAINWLVVRALFRSPRLTRMLEGRPCAAARVAHSRRADGRDSSPGIWPPARGSPLRAGTERHILRGGIRAVGCREALQRCDGQAGCDEQGDCGGASAAGCGVMHAAS